MKYIRLGDKAVIFPVKKIQAQTRVLPRFLAAQSILAKPTPRSSTSDSFNLFGNRFASLMQKENLEGLQPYLIEIDISEEISLLKAEYSLEITVPVLGMTDLLGFTQNAQQFACPVAINGFGAKSATDTFNNFPHPDFVLITDIAGNQYEVVVTPDGKIELPSDGTGLFSIVSSITYIYSERQIKFGAGLENLQSEAIAENKLFLLPPINSFETFTSQICITHIDNDHKRKVDTIRKVEIKYPTMTLDDYQPKVITNRISSGDTDLLSVGISWQTKSTFNHPLTACVTVESIHDTSVADANGWLQHPIDPNMYTKHIGLSENTLNFLIRRVYSEYDLMKDYLKGDTFSLSHQNGYNNFLLMPEVFGRFYDFLIHDLIHHKLPADFLFARVPTERLRALETSDIPVDFHDSIVLSRLQANLAEDNFQDFKKLFRSEASTQNELADYFILRTDRLQDSIPQVSVTLIAKSNLFESGLPDYHANVKTGATWGRFSDEPTQASAQLSPEQSLLKSGIYNAIDLSEVLESASGWTPMMATTAQEMGKQVDISSSTEKKDPIDNKKEEKTNPSATKEVDPSRIHTRR